MTLKHSLTYTLCVDPEGGGLIIGLETITLVWEEGMDFGLVSGGLRSLECVLTVGDSFGATMCDDFGVSIMFNLLVP